MSGHPGDIQTKKEITGLIHRLNGSDPGPAWAEFIDCFSSLILKTAQQFEYEQDRLGECYLYVCEKLCEGGFRRILKFNTGGDASFRTWLGTVVFNLCVDWHRREFGRVTLLPLISALSEFDQSVYRLRYERGLDLQDCLHGLQDDFPDLTAQQLSDSLARIHAALTPRQRWKLSVSVRRRQRDWGENCDPSILPGATAEPESQACDEEARHIVRKALQQLPRDQQLAIELRYIQGMTLTQVAEVLDLGDPFRAKRLIQSALEQLARLVPESIGTNLV